MARLPTKSGVIQVVGGQSLVMKLVQYVDPFFDRQPELEFIEELKKPVHIKAPEKWGRRDTETGEVVLNHGVRIIREFDDTEGVLDTAYFERFLNVHGIPQNGSYRLRITYAQTACSEAYEIIIGSDKCIIRTADTEGVRRALVYLEDEMLRREDPYLPIKTISRKPFVKTRLTRCFFSPTNRPPKNGDELSVRI